MSRVITGLVLVLVLIWAAPSTVRAAVVGKGLVEKESAQPVQTITEDLLYQTVHGRDSMADIAMLIKKQPDRSALIEASIIAYGRGVDFRRLEAQRPIILVGGDRIQPIDVEKIHVQKSSVASPVAPILFGILGSQYEGPGARAAASPGQVCPVTGQPLSDGGHTSERGDVARAIDKAGMAAGMALLTSQAKGDLDGIKVRWQLSPSVKYSDLKLSFDAYNKNSKKTEPLSLSISYDPDASLKKIAPITYLPIRFNVSVESGAVVTDQRFTVSPYSMNKFQITVENLLRGRLADADAWVPRNSKLEYAGSDYWDDYQHEWDDFDEDGYCHECGHYDPQADEFNYDADGKYLGDTRVIPDKQTRIFIDPKRLETYTRDNITGEKLTFFTDYPVTKALFKTEAVNKRTNELLVITSPVIIKDTRE